MFEENNIQRLSKGLPAHQLNSTLCKMAQDHANYMARTGAFEHDANGGLQGRARRYEWKEGCSENIAKGQRNIRSAFSSWMGSRGHRAAILGNYKYVGFGYQISKSGQPYWVGVYSR